MKKLFLGILVGAFAISAQAIEIRVTNVNCGGLGGTSTTGLCGDLTDELRGEVNADQPEVNIDKYADGIANATGFSMKGQNSDYAENFNWFVLKPSFGLAVQGEIDDPEGAEGVGLGGALTVGINLDLLPVDKIGFIEFDKMDLFVSFMSYNLDQDIGDDGGTGEGEISSFSVMARYQIMEGNDIFPGYMLEWGGVHVHTGIQRNSMGIELTQSFDDETVEDGNGNSGTFSDASATFDMDSTVTSIPLEVSTYLRMAYVFTLYGGVGFDYNLTAETDVSLNAGGTFTGDGGTGGYSADIDADESASGEGAATNFRNFVGVQVNVPFVRVYAQVNQGMGNDLMGVNFGVKMTY